MERVAFLFPGQGAQYVGMGKKIAQTVPAARSLFDKASEILEYDLAKICFEGPAEELNTTVVGQPALFVTSLAALESLRSEAPEIIDQCEFAAGLSLGEYTAMVFAGAMDFESGLQVVRERGAAMQAAAEQSASGMASVLGLAEDQVEELCDQARGAEVLEIANYLCPGNFVVSGHTAAIDRLEPLLTAAEAMNSVRLNVAGAFHTELMQPAVEKLKSALEKIALASPRLPVVSNVDAIAHTDPVTLREILVRQVVQPVYWEQTIRGMLNEGVTSFYEIGPGKVLRGLLKRIHRKVSCTNIIG